MTEPREDLRWTSEDVELRLEAVRDELLSFLRARTRFDWFKHKVRWRLSRKYIWPGAPEGLDALLDEAIERDGGIEAFADYLRTRQLSITTAIERYNLAVRRLMEQERGVPVSQFDEASRVLLRERRITFQGTRDELLRRARRLTPESGSELIPELLSLRLAILSEEVRDQLFSEVAAIIADEAADANPEMTTAQRRLLAEETELRLRRLDQIQVARLLAENYAEARRMMSLDEQLGWYESLCREEAAAPGADALRGERIELLREVLLAKLADLEAIFPMTKGTHEREARLLRDPAWDGT